MIFLPAEKKKDLPFDFFGKGMYIKYWLNIVDWLFSGAIPRRWRGKIAKKIILQFAFVE